MGFNSGFKGLIINLGFGMEMASDHWTKGMEFGNFEVIFDKFISLRFHWMCILTTFHSDDLCGNPTYSHHKTSRLKLSCVVRVNRFSHSMPADSLRLV